MYKSNRKISILDYLILLMIIIFFSIVYFYSSIIWPREEKFKSIDRNRMEMIDSAQQLSYIVTNDYYEDGRIPFALIESLKDTLYGDSLFEGTKKILLAKRNKKYIITNPINNQSDTLLIPESVSRSVEFSEGFKLFSRYIFNKMELRQDSLSDDLYSQIQKQLKKNLIIYSTSRIKNEEEKYKISMGAKVYNYTINDYNSFVESNIYSIGNNKWDKDEEFIDLNNNNKWDSGEQFIDSHIFYTSLVDNGLLSQNDLESNTYEVDIPVGFKNRLDTTFTKPIKIEEFYEDSIYSVRVLNLDPSDNFLDSNNNGKKDFDEYYYDIAYVNSKSLIDYKGEDFLDSNNNNKWDSGEKYDDVNNNGEYDIGKESYLGVIPNQDIIYTVAINDSVFEIPSYKYNIYIKKEYISDESIKSKRSVNFKVVSRKKISMDYFSNSDTLTSDSLYSSINFFKRGYDNKDLFNINITRFEDELYKLNLNNNGFNTSKIYSESQRYKNTKLAGEYYSQDILVSLPFIDEYIGSTLFYKKLDPPNIIISSPVPKNQNWTYWQKIDLVSINDIDGSDYSTSSISLPTPFSFYTGDRGKIVDHIKSWVD